MRPPRSRAVRLRGSKAAKPKAPLDTAWPRLVLSDRLYLTSRRWWGCRTGSGLWVLDLDLKEGHKRVLTAWTRDHGPIPGWHVRSASGGRHVYMRGPHDLPPRYRIPVEGFAGVELHANAASQVVWPSAPGYEPLSERPDPLPDAPPWLIALAGNHPSPTAPRPSLGGGLAPGERERYGSPAEYVAVILGEVPERGLICCPAPDHEDRTPSCQVRGHNLRCWTHPGGPLTMRARQLAAIALGLGEYRAGSWVIDSSEDRAAVAAHLDDLFPAVS